MLIFMDLDRSFFGSGSWFFEGRMLDFLLVLSWIIGFCNGWFFVDSDVVVFFGLDCKISIFQGFGFVSFADTNM